MRFAKIVLISRVNSVGMGIFKDKGSVAYKRILFYIKIVASVPVPKIIETIVEFAKVIIIL